MIYLYVEELIAWLVLMIFLIFLFRKMPQKIKNADDPKTKNSLFILMLIIGLPILIFEVLAPLLILMGDERMPKEYKYAFGAEILLVIIYFLSTQRHKKKKTD